MWRCVPLVLFLCLCAVPAFAQVPQATIERIVALNVQFEEGRYLWQSSQIDDHTWSVRQEPITTERNTLLQLLRKVSADEQKQANSQIDGLTKARLALLRPQWQAQAAAFKGQREQHDRAVIDAIGVDTRTALETQRSRALLQQRRDRGEITAEEFATEDKKALGEIMALRGKYVREGQPYVDRFDSQLAQLTQAVSNNPVTPPPVPKAETVQGNAAQDKAAQGGTSAADYKRDVALAIDIWSREKEAIRRHEKKEIDDAKYRESSDILNADLMRLARKWQAAGRGNEFGRDYLQPDVDALVAADKAAQAKMVNGDTLGPDYKRDVEQAADLQFQEGQFANRNLNKEIDDAAYDKSIKALNARLTPLKAKWQAAGREREFQRDYMQRVTDLAVAAQSRGGGILGILSLPVLIGVAVVVGLCLILWLSSKKTPAQRPVSDVYGTAHYAPTQLDVVDDACLSRGLFFGKSSAPELARLPLDIPGAPVCSTPEHHTLIVARTRTGKGTRVIVPTLLRYRGSALVIDPKGENAAITARIRKDQLHQSIHILNPWNELAQTYQRGGFTQATFNPLDILDRNDPNAVAIAQTLAGAICPAPANAKDGFWQGSAANILTAVFLWLADRPEEKKTLGRAREIVSLTRKEFTAKFLTQMAASEAFSGAIREMAAPFIDLADETYSGVMSNLSESTRFLSDPQIKAATATSSFAMEDLATEKATVYVVIPTERMDAQKTWLRLVIAAAMHIFKHPRAKLEYGHRCLFLIDEFAALGRLDDLPRDIATMSGFGVDFALIVQGLDQLKDHYSEAKGTILSNCAYKWFCNVNDLESAKYLSDTLGKKTVGTTSTSESFSASSGNRSSEGHTTSHSETGRSLLNPDEVLNLGRDVAIAIQPNGHPHYLRPVDYWNQPRAFGYLREGHPTLYWDPPIAYDENPYFAAPPPPPLPSPG